MAGDDDSCRVWVGNLSHKVDEELIYELFLQAGPIDNVVIPKDGSGRSGYAFVTFKHECSVMYAVDLFDRTELFGRELKIRPKQRQMPVQHNELHSLTSLRGLSGDLGMKGRCDLSDRFIGKSPNLMPKENITASSSQIGLLPNAPDFNLLLQMGQQLQLLQNPYGGVINDTLGPFPSPMYPSQIMNSVMNKHREDSGERSDQNDYRSHYRHERDCHSDHPYRDNRQDRSYHDNRHNRSYHDNRHDRNFRDTRNDDRHHGHNNSRHHQSSRSHRRERR